MKRSKKLYMIDIMKLLRDDFLQIPASMCHDTELHGTKVCHDTLEDGRLQLLVAQLVTIDFAVNGAAADA